MNIDIIKRTGKRTKPCKMGDNLLILATAPDVKRFFEDENIRERFKNYDVAFLNKMPLISETEMHKFKPKYLIFMDGVFYEKDFDGPNKGNERKRWVERVAANIDWDCYIVTPYVADFEINNIHIKYIGITPFVARYKRQLDILYRKNVVNPGMNNVVIGALYFGITFGYKQIGILGFSYRMGYSYMDVDGFHTEGYPHYYDEDTHKVVLDKSRIFIKNESYLLRLAKRNVISQQQLCDIALYAKIHNSHIINYTPESNMDVFDYCEL